MRRAASFLSNYLPELLIALCSIGLVSVLFLFRLGTLTQGLNTNEIRIAGGSYGWHGLYYHPLFMPIAIIRSIIFWLHPNPSQFLIRLPSVFFGAFGVVCYGFLMNYWHGSRVALISSLLYICSAWTLHTVRLGTNDAVYSLMLPLLFLLHALLQRYARQALIYYLSIVAISMCLFIPGMIWIIAVIVYRARHELLNGFNARRSKLQKIFVGILALYWLPLLALSFIRSTLNLRQWLGLPLQFSTPARLGKQLVAVGVHLFIRGPEYPYLWLGRLPLLDTVSLCFCVLGIYYYIRNFKAQRAKMLCSVAIIGIIIVALNGLVSLSLLVPLLYFSVAAGMSYMLRQWFQRFPQNPIARSFGIGLVGLVIVLSGVYNIRAYFIAWPHDPSTQASFQRRPE